ncbi:hypothetical protein BTVI_71900 [Pitangus sulphuratus]|nr:hypothetical protein BTVI_71900 [Pitangus sulphuratus]
MESIVPPSFMSSANLLSIPSSPVSKSFMKMFKSTGSKMEHCGTPLVTSHQSGDPDRCPVHYYPLCLTHEPIAYPPHDVFIKLCAGNFVQRDLVRDSIESFTEILKDCFNWLLLMDYVGYLAIKGNQF